MSKRRPESHTVVVAEGATSPSGYAIEFSRGFSDPPEPGTLLLLSNSGKHAVVESSVRTIGGGTGAAASAVVMKALGCGPDTRIWFRRALFRDWLRHSENARRRLTAWVAELVIIITGLVLLILGELNSSTGLLTAVVVSATVLLIAHIVVEYVRFKNMTTSASTVPV